jgi:hypothetical protein
MERAMPATKQKAAKPAKPAKAAKAAKTVKASKPSKAVKPAVRMTLEEVMATLAKSGSAQTKKTYARHGASEPMFGVSFATLGGLVKRIGVDHELAMQLWDTGNFDARNLAMKIVDPARMTPGDLDRWAKDMTVRMCAGYVSMIACEGPHGHATVMRWLGSADEQTRASGWGLVAQIALRDPNMPEGWCFDRLAEITKGIHDAPNDERYAMNNAVIMLGCRSPALKRAALAAAKKIGKVDVDHGDTSCKTPDAGPYIEKTWAYASSKGFPTPAAQEQQRESPRTRC